MENFDTIDANLQDGIVIDESVRSSLLASAKWARIIAIFSLLMMILALINYLVVISKLHNLAPDSTVQLVISFIVVIGLMVYPSIALFGFHSKTKKAFANTSQTDFQAALKDLKGFFSYSGILLIISGALTILGVLGNLASMS